MEQTEEVTLAKPLNLSSNLPKILVAVIVIALISGITTGFYLSNKDGSPGKVATTLGQPPKVASEDSKTFRDFAEGTMKVKATTQNQYSEGTHTLERDGAVPVALTSSVVDLSQFEGKKVKVYGETQKALQEGWLMDVGKVEEVK